METLVADLKLEWLLGRSDGAHSDVHLLSKVIQSFLAIHLC